MPWLAALLRQLKELLKLYRQSMTYQLQTGTSLTCGEFEKINKSATVLEAALIPISCASVNTMPAFGVTRGNLRRTAGRSIALRFLTAPELGSCGERSGPSLVARARRLQSRLCFCAPEPLTRLSNEKLQGRSSRSHPLRHPRTFTSRSR